MPLVRNSFIHLLDNVSSENCAITLTSKICFGLADIGQRVWRRIKQGESEKLQVLSFPPSMVSA
jgi:hypothetical protein